MPLRKPRSMGSGFLQHTPCQTDARKHMNDTTSRAMTGGAERDTRRPDVSYLILQDDGSLVVYRQGPAAWSTSTQQ